MAVQFDPIKPILKAPGIKLLKLKYASSRSSFAFKFNLRCYTWESPKEMIFEMPTGGDLHSSTFQLNVSRFGHTSPCPTV